MVAAALTARLSAFLWARASGHHACLDRPEREARWWPRRSGPTGVPTCRAAQAPPRVLARCQSGRNARRPVDQRVRTRRALRVAHKERSETCRRNVPAARGHRADRRGVPKARGASERAGLADAQLASLTFGSAADQCWPEERDRLLIQAVDSLHGQADISDDLWRLLSAAFSEANLLDLLLLCGWYHAISFVARAARVPPEPGAPRFARTDENWSLSARRPRPGEPGAGP